MREGFVKVAAVAPKLHLGDIKANLKEIAKVIKEHKDVAIFLFPELSLTGYSLGDLHLNSLVEARVNEALEELKGFCLEQVVIVGAPIWYEGRIYNCAVVMQNQKILGIVPKSYLANYKEFYEKRWFTSGKDLSTDIDGIPFGTDILFEYGKLCFGIEICEDLWSLIPPSFYQAASGANLIFNLSASDDYLGKHDYRKSLVSSQSARTVSGYIYASSSVGESGADVIYGGATLIAENGYILAEGERFRFDTSIIKADIDIEKLRYLRVSETSYKDAPKKEFRKVRVARLVDTPIKRKFDPHPFLPKSDLDKRAREILSIQSTALGRRVMHIGKDTKLVIGLSGGLDSTLALLVCYECCKILDKSPKDIIAISMPGFGTTSSTREDAKRLAEILGVTFKEIDITQSVGTHLKDIGHGGECDVTFENAQARERTQILMDISNMEGGIVVGTGDLSEIALGFATYNGDHMSMYGVNSSVPKTLVRYLIEWYAKKEGGRIEEVLQNIIRRPISPELLPADNGEITQKTEDIIGPYELHDFFLYHFVKYGAAPCKILFMAVEAFEWYEREFIKKYLILFLKRFFANQFKRDAMPDGVKVGTISLSPRGDWRMPSDALVNEWIRELERC